MIAGVDVTAERGLGADQSNTSVVLGERVLLKAFRRLQPGLNPELELGAYLSEEAAFAAVPPLAGFAELVSSRQGTETVAIAQAFIGDGADAYESVAETLTAWVLAPGEVSVEFASEVAADLGTLTAGLHSALASARGLPDLEPRDASRAELRAWSRAARTGLARAMEVTAGEAAALLRDLAPRIRDAFAAFEASATLPLLTRIHADYHLGQILIAPDGYRIVDFEGDPMRTMDERRALDSPLRDVASMLRSLDHVGRSAGRRAEARNGGPVESPGLDLDAWCAARANGSRLRTARACASRVKLSRWTQRCCGPSSWTRNAGSSSTRRPTCRRGSGLRLKGCAACSNWLRRATHRWSLPRRLRADPQSPRAARTSPTRRMLSKSNGERNTKMTSPMPLWRYPSK
jgi:trehalose synthase-fused probable maltokinase